MKQNFGLYLILTDPVTDYETCAKAAVECDVRYLQLRMKHTPRAELLETALMIRSITAGTNTRFILNDDISIAIECDADGIHLGQDDLSLKEARATWNASGKLFGLSTHSLQQAMEAEPFNPDYIGVGPVFPTPTKTDAGPSLGIAETGRIAKTTPLTSVAIGGVNAENLPLLLAAGVENYCVIRAVNQSKNPISAIRNLQKIKKNHFSLEPNRNKD